MILGLVTITAVRTENPAETATPSPTFPVSQSVARNPSIGKVAIHDLRSVRDLTLR
jgi:hypothetical protein